MDWPRTIHFVASDRGGSGRWRSWWPASVLEDAGYTVRVEEYRDWLRYTRPSPDDLVIAHRPEFAARWIQPQRLMQRLGVRVVVDEDDDVTNLPRSFDINVRRQMREWLPAHNQSISEADGLIVSTPRLQEVYGHLAKRTWVKPNLIADWVQHTAASLTGDVVRVGWAGITRTHTHDLGWLLPALEQALDGAVLWTVGDDWTPRVLGLPKEKHQWLGLIRDPSIFYREMSKADIGIVPLDVRESVNLGKSYIKALEYMTMGRPVVGMSTLPEQAKMIVHGETGFLAATPQEFAGYVQRLVKDKPLRLEMGKAGKERAQQFTISAKGKQWLDVVEELQGEEAMQPAGVREPATVR